MDNLLDRLGELESLASAVVGEILATGSLTLADDHDIVRALSLAAQARRWIDALIIEGVGEVDARSSGAERDDRLTTRFGCRDVSELVQIATRLSPQSVGQMRKAVSAVRVGRSIITGEMLEPELPAIRAAMVDGVLGVDGVLAVAAPLQSMGYRVDRQELLAADSVLAAEARGSGPDGAPPLCAELLRLQAQAWAAALDQDGAEPREAVQMHRRGITLGTATPHGVPIRGMLMPEVAGQLQRVFDATMAPRGESVRFDTGGTGVDDAVIPVDTRTRAQKQHDALANALTVAASSRLLPTIGGAAPTLVVSVRAEDLARGSGYAHVDGCDEPVAIAAARHIACAGAVQRVTMRSDGRIVSIGNQERVFNRHQRRAIALRDGGCIIPGCGVPAGWCEIHHVLDHAKGGPTHTDNGVLLCWFHHRFLERHGWQIRMNCGVPEVKAPGWIESRGRWRCVTRSKTRLADAVRRT